MEGSDGGGRPLTQVLLLPLQDGKETRGSPFLQFHQNTKTASAKSWIVRRRVIRNENELVRGAALLSLDFKLRFSALRLIVIRALLSLRFHCMLGRKYTCLHGWLPPSHVFLVPSPYAPARRNVDPRARQLVYRTLPSVRTRRPACLWSYCRPGTQTQARTSLIL